MKLLCANWKMNLGVAESAVLTERLAELSKTLRASEVWVSCSSAALSFCGAKVLGSKVLVGAQNAFGEEKGAFTGEISAPVLRECGAGFSLVGHSERRHIFGESRELCGKRALGLLQAGIKVIFCVGETLAERQAGDKSTIAVIESQCQSLIAGLEHARGAFQENLQSQLTLAYEPVWAIGTGLAATTAQISEIHAAIANLWKEQCALPCPRILYGGSVNKSNFREIIALESVAGGLIGGASNTFESFSELIAIAEESR